MKNGRMQCKDIPTTPILIFIHSHGGEWCNWFDVEISERSVLHVMPPETPDRLVLAKMRALIRSGLVDGCDCGCRGDYVLTEKGRAMIGQETDDDKEWKKFHAMYLADMRRLGR